MKIGKIAVRQKERMYRASTKSNKPNLDTVPGTVLKEKRYDEVIPWISANVKTLARPFFLASFIRDLCVFSTTKSGGSVTRDDGWSYTTHCFPSIRFRCRDARQCLCVLGTNLDEACI